MKPSIGLLILFLLVCLSPAYAQSAGESDPQPFHFSSRGTGYGVQGEFEGTYLIDEDLIEVNVTKATIYVSEHCPYQGRRSINQLKFGLATETDSHDSWKIESAAQPIYLELVMSPKEEYSLYDLHFLIAKESGMDMAKRWLVVEIQTDPLDGPREKNKRGYVYASSCRDVFERGEGKTTKR
jgi:hypothetical protein